MGRPQSEAMTLALAAITNKRKTKRLTPPQAAAEFGVQLQSIYRRPEYKTWRAKQLEAANG